MKKIRKYSCANCGGSVRKPACVAPPAPTKNHKGQTVERKIEYHGLHGWRCDACGSVKVECKLEDYNSNG